MMVSITARISKLLAQDTTGTKKFLNEKVDGVNISPRM